MQKEGDEMKIPVKNSALLCVDKELTKTPNLVRCDNSLSTPKDPADTSDATFEFCRFTQYLKVHNALERQERLLSLRNGKPVSSITDYTDPVLLNELFTIYGLMDTSHPLFHKIFQNYKEERLEELAEWMAEEKYLTEDLKDQKIDLTNSTFTITEERLDLEKIFSEKELIAFEDVGHGNSVIERFVLPRYQNTASAALKSLRDAGAFTNLSLFDPQMNLPRGSLPYSSAESEDVIVGDKLTSALQVLVHPHVTGIQASGLARAYKSEKGYEPDYRSLGCTNFSELIIHLPEIIWRQQVEESFNALHYPNYVEGLICTPSMLFRTLCHKFVFILATSHGLIEVTKAMKQFEEIFGFKLSDTILAAWGFECPDEFFRTIFDKFWTQKDVSVVSYSEVQNLIRKPKNKHDTLSFYLIRRTRNFSRRAKSELNSHHSICSNEFSENSMRKLGSSVPNFTPQTSSQNSKSFSFVPKQIKSDLTTITKHINGTLSIPTSSAASVISKSENTSNYGFQPNPTKRLTVHAGIMLPPKTIPHNCMQHGEVIEKEFGSVTLKQKTECMLGYFLSPTHFYLVLARNWNKLLDFQDLLTDDYTNWLDDAGEYSSLIVNPALLKPGLYLVAMTGDNNDREFRRAQYIQRMPNNTHQVLLIDYGDSIIVNEQSLLFLRKFHAHTLPAQALMCGIFNVEAPKVSGSGSGDNKIWSDDLTNKCYEMINREPMEVKFLSIQEEGCRKYLVKAFGPNGQDVGQCLMKIIRNPTEGSRK